MTPYRTLFIAELVQDSALSIGGSEPDEPLVDAHFCRDGSERLTMRGEGLAGALVATARKIVGEISPFISSGFGAQSTTPSRWNVFTSHPKADTETEIRSCVGIRHDTQARAKGVLFDTEATPRGTIWPFILDVDSFGKDGAEATRLAAAVLLEWQRGRCWIGRDIARGMGWMQVRSLRALRLDVSHFQLWPDSREEPASLIESLPGTWIPSVSFEDTFGTVTHTKRWHYVEVTGEIVVGPREDGYGLDSLAVGGHDLTATTPTLLPTYLCARGMDNTAFEAAFDPDDTISLTRTADGTIEPLIPGGGLRGPQRHGYSRRLRTANPMADIRDPNVLPEDPDRASDPIEELFGTISRSATLLVRDAHIVDLQGLSTAVLQHHAEDEFVAGVFGSSKFDRAVIMTGRFAWKMVLETSDPALETRFLEEWLPYLEALGTNRALPIGAAKWRSAGWPEWRIDTIRCGTAGTETEIRREATAV